MLTLPALALVFAGGYLFSMMLCVFVPRVHCGLPSKSHPAIFHGRFVTRTKLAALLAVRFLLPDFTETHEAYTVEVTKVLTDTRGNGHVLTKLSSSKFPISAIVMELGSTLKTKGLSLDVAWVPREANNEDDMLSNLDTSLSDDSNRIDMDLVSINWLYVNDALEHGTKYFDQISKKAREDKRSAGPQRKRRRGDELRNRAPW